ncbi:class I SAM-dependent methyltransferase [Nocardia colli]|uniref:Class I SAM-dependent methyltransferase n=1 Tax=Nocardia colli TaxID=2545717 RepID=A0A5N0DXI1_9NOCA|nr:class I SAM-dependent methyltransferase [Nocardia colli]KAA8880654.1 class I SAM-dependent methyltransferase [Nocardia colli]
MEPNQWDTVAESYDEVKHVPAGLAETATLTAVMPDLAGKSVLDVGSGTGYYARLFRHLGAARVVGVDAAAQMIRRARSIDKFEGLSIDYQHYDAAEMPVLGAFDVISAVWLFGNIAGAAELSAVAGRLRANLAADWMLVALFPNPEVDYESPPEYGKYGLTYTPTRLVADRQAVTVRFLTVPPVEFEGYFWRPGVVEEILRKAGFADIERHATKVPPSAVAEYGPQFWAELLANPHFAVITAHAGGSDDR